MRTILRLIMLYAVTILLCALPTWAHDVPQDEKPAVEPAATAPGNDTLPDAEKKDAGLKLFDTPSFTLVLKNVSQKDQSGNSGFGVGLDWRYSFERQLPARSESEPNRSDPAEHCGNKAWNSTFAFNASLSGKGFTSLGDAQNSRSEASEASNFNSITNRVRYAGFLRVLPPCERVDVDPRTLRPDQLAAWKRANSVRGRIEADAEHYTAADFGFHAESESDQDFGDTQVALGASVTLASGYATHYFLFPLKFLVPNQDEYGNVVQSPQAFMGIEEVVGASHRKAIDGASDEDFTRFRLEIGWTSELFVPGLYPFVRYHHYEELGAEAAIRAAGKASTDFYEVGANYYVGEKFESVRKLFGDQESLRSLSAAPKGFSDIFSRAEGPFVTLRYAAGELPPYLESDHQATVGLGIAF